MLNHMVLMMFNGDGTLTKLWRLNVFFLITPQQSTQCLIYFLVLINVRFNFRLVLVYLLALLLLLVFLLFKKRQLEVLHFVCFTSFFFPFFIFFFFGGFFFLYLLYSFGRFPNLIIWRTIFVMLFTALLSRLIKWVPFNVLYDRTKKKIVCKPYVSMLPLTSFFIVVFANCLEVLLYNFYVLYSSIFNIGKNLCNSCFNHLPGVLAKDFILPVSRQSP